MSGDVAIPFRSETMANDITYMNKNKYNSLLVLIMKGVHCMRWMKKVGFYRELKDYGHFFGPKITDAIRSQKQQYEDELITYLQQGHVLCIAPMYCTDVLSHEPIEYSPHDRTDGDWIWPGELDYYVSVYHIQIRHDFIQHARRNQWQVPALSDKLINEIAHSSGWSILLPPWSS